MEVLGVLSDDLLDLLKAALVPGIDDQQHRSLGHRQQFHNQQSHGDHRGHDEGHHMNGRIADDADGNGPEQEHQIHGRFHRRTETDDGQRTHHTQRHHDVELDGQHHGADDDGQHGDRHIEILIVEGLSGHILIQEEQVSAQQRRDEEAHRHIGHRDIGGGERVQERIFENITECRHYKSPNFLHK